MASYTTYFIFLLTLFFSSASSSLKPDIVVDQNGFGNYKTINDALDHASQLSELNRVIIYIKEGVYDEYLQINQQNITLLGDGKNRTIISGNRSAKAGFGTFDSSTIGKFSFT